MSQEVSSGLDEVSLLAAEGAYQARLWTLHSRHHPEHMIEDFRKDGTLETEISDLVNLISTPEGLSSELIAQDTLILKFAVRALRLNIIAMPHEIKSQSPTVGFFIRDVIVPSATQELLTEDWYASDKKISTVGHPFGNDDYVHALWRVADDRRAWRKLDPFKRLDILAPGLEN